MKAPDGQPLFPESKNSKLYTCVACGWGVALGASSCPRCGKASPAFPTALWIALGIVAILAAALFYGILYGF